MNRESFSQKDFAGDRLSEVISGQIEESIDVKQALLDDPQSIKTIDLICQKLIECYRSGKKVIFMGNGGSAADAQHLACELVSKFQMERKALPALALSVNSSIITAVGNDYDFGHIFTRQIEAMVNDGDVVIGISTSGNSQNIINAVNRARELGATIITFTGANGGKLARISDICFRAPSDNTPRIQEAHITVGHIVCGIVEKVLFD